MENKSQKAMREQIAKMRDILIDLQMALDDLSLKIEGGGIPSASELMKRPKRERDEAMKRGAEVMKDEYEGGGESHATCQRGQRREQATHPGDAMPSKNDRPALESKYNALRDAVEKFDSKWVIAANGTPQLHEWIMIMALTEDGGQLRGASNESTDPIDRPALVCPTCNGHGKTGNVFYPCPDCRGSGRAASGVSEANTGKEPEE